MLGDLKLKLPQIMLTLEYQGQKSLHILWLILDEIYHRLDKIFRCKRLSTGANFVHVYIEIWDKGILKLNKFSMQQVKKNNNVII